MTAPDDPREQSARDACIQRLRDGRERAGKMPPTLLASTAERFGVSINTVRRWVNKQYSPRPGPFELDREQLALIAAFGGNRKAAHQEAVKRGIDGDVGYRTWTEAYNRVPAHTRLAIEEGMQAAKAALPYAVRTESPVNGRWEADGWQPPIRVRKRRGSTLVRPTVMLIVDHRSRLVVGHCVAWPGTNKSSTPKPKGSTRSDRGALNSDIAVATVAAALRIRPVDTEALDAHGDFSDVSAAEVAVGGRPDVLVVDNEGALRGGAMQELAHDAGFDLHRATPYTGENKGVVESLNGTFEISMAALPGLTKGPRSISGRQIFDAPEMGQDEFEQLIADLVEDYNFRRGHSSLDGRTPFEAFMDREIQLREVPEVLLRGFRMPHPERDGERRLEGRGVRVDNEYYTLDSNAYRTGIASVGDNVLIRIEPGNRDWVDVWSMNDHPEHLGRARRQADLPVDDRVGLMEARIQMQRGDRDVLERANELLHNARLGGDNGQPSDHVDASEVHRVVRELQEVLETVPADRSTYGPEETEQRSVDDGLSDSAPVAESETAREQADPRSNGHSRAQPSASSNGDPRLRPDDVPAEFQRLAEDAS